VKEGRGIFFRIGDLRLKSKKEPESVGKTLKKKSPRPTAKGPGDGPARGPYGPDGADFLRQTLENVPLSDALLKIFFIEKNGCFSIASILLV
jgi:hypothetical protein